MPSSPLTISLRDSQTIHLLRIVAMLSVMAAHVNKITEGNTIDLLITRFWNAFGTVGVAIFLIVGGMVYHRSPEDGLTFWGKKFHRLIVPWLFCATLTYLLSALLSRRFACIDYFTWVSGIGTWYYYISVFLVMLFAFKWIENSTIALGGCIFFTVLSLALESFSIVPHNSFFTKYINVFNWIGFFAVGCVIRKIGLETFREFLTRKSTVCIGWVLFLILLCVILRMREFSYFNPLAFLWELIAFCVLFQLSWFAVHRKTGELMAVWGRLTYCIYLIHMQFVQALCARLPQTTLFLFLKPIVALLTISVVVYCLDYLCGRFPSGAKIKRLMGL